MLLLALHVQKRSEIWHHMLHLSENRPYLQVRSSLSAATSSNLHSILLDCHAHCGPLVKISGGHQYILVICDYATQFPEAFPLHTITAPTVWALVQLFSSVGIPDDILTDQRTNEG